MSCRLIILWVGWLLAPLAIAAPVAPNHVPGQILIRFSLNTSTMSIQRVIRAQGATLPQGPLDSVGWTQVTLPAGLSVAQAVASYQGQPGVLAAQPNYIYRIQSLPNNPLMGQQWAIQNTGQTIAATSPYANMVATNNPGVAGNDLDVLPAWNHVTDCRSVIVAVVDTGVNYRQQGLAQEMWNGGSNYPNHGWNYTGEGSAADPMDFNGHGTHVAGLIGSQANNGLGTTGVCWQSTIMAVRVLNDTGAGTDSTIIQGINFAVTHGARIINMSLGGNGPFDQALSDAITTAENANVVVVVAAGNGNSMGVGQNNDAPGNSIYPCDFTQPNLICVAALDQAGQRAAFSNYGPTSVDVGAPGTNILSTYAGNEVTIRSGLHSGWTFLQRSTTGSVSSWSYAVSASGTDYLSVPSNWATGAGYSSGPIADAYTSVNLAGASAAVLTADLYVNVLSPSDVFSLADSSSGGNPYSPSSPAYLIGPFANDAAPASAPTRLPLQFLSLAHCLTSSCTVGMELSSSVSTDTDLGAAVDYFSVGALTLTNNAYAVDTGTSMASPLTAGVAALVLSANPNDTAAEVVQSLEAGGRPNPALAGITTSGNAVDAMRALAYLHAVVGLSAVIQ